MTDAIARVRHFNRFYTEQIGLLDEHLLDSDYSLAEVRILYEIQARERATAAPIARDLGVDRGAMSRFLKRLERQGLVLRATSPDDARVGLLSLTAKGRRIFRKLDIRANEEVATLLRGASAKDQQRLLGAMVEIERILSPPAEPKAPFILRDPHSGDLGWVVHRHGALYSREYRYDRRFEALVATIVGEFVERFDPRFERCWIAEKDSEVAGSVFLVRSTASVAKLRLLYVEPAARGHGIGDRLIAECIRFAREAGYKKVVLWTQSELHAARHLYAKAGFALTKEEPHSSFGRDDLVAETWELSLGS